MYELQVVKNWFIFRLEQAVTINVLFTGTFTVNVFLPLSNLFLFPAPLTDRANICPAGHFSSACSKVSVNGFALSKLNADITSMVSPVVKTHFACAWLLPTENAQYLKRWVYWKKSQTAALFKNRRALLPQYVPEIGATPVYPPRHHGENAAHFYSSPAEVLFFEKFGTNRHIHIAYMAAAAYVHQKCAALSCC